MLAHQKYKSTIRKHSDDDEQNRNFHCNGLGFKLEKLKFSLAQRISRIFLSFLRLALRFSTITKKLLYVTKSQLCFFFVCLHFGIESLRFVADVSIVKYCINSPNAIRIFASVNVPPVKWVTCAA